MATRSRHDSAYTVQAPRHPVSTLQEPFEESMLEAAHDETEDIYPDPVTRRNTLLEAPVYTRVVAGRWKQKPGERFHPLWKLIAQVSFGIHLLAQGMAKSEDEVMQILQAHVDEIDGFLERTTEDFDLAQEDIQERLRCLKLPLSHLATFDKMLEDRNFRLSIVEGNEKIEHIVERTSQAMKDSLKDVQKGFDSTSCLEKYLHGLSATWQRQTVEHEAVFVAMLGNVEGWRKAFMSLHMQGNKLGGSLKKLTDIINEMQARAGEVSRRLLYQARVQHQQVMGRPTGRSTPTSRFQNPSSKQLPTIRDRPLLRQSASQGTVRTTPTMRSSSQDSLQQQAMISRSQTPQYDMPTPRQVSNSASPRIIQIGSNSQVRIQSMVPSLLEAVAPSRETLVTLKSQAAEEEEQPERYFPPVELPANVPDETMRTVPMSKQNRLSVGLGLTQASKAEKRNSRLGTSALVDLLRTNPVSSGGVSTSPKPKSPEVSRRTTKVASMSSPPRSSSISDTTTAHTKNNKIQPKKGAQHWFDALELDDDLLESDKYSVQEHPSPRMAKVAADQDKKTSEHGSGPSTPTWAVTSFAQVEKRKELLKKGAFNSHPPGVPLGSPPLVQETFQSPLAVAAPQRRPSHASSTGQISLGEPGPEVAASEAGSVSARNNQAMKRASAYAPEVVVEKVPPLPTPNRQFVAEMEGSSPAVPAVQQSSSSIRDVVMELEAPLQYFNLAPRPNATHPTAMAKTQTQPAHTAELEAYQQHFRLPPRPDVAMPKSPAHSDDSFKPAVQVQTDSGQSTSQETDDEEAESQRDSAVVMLDRFLVPATAASEKQSKLALDTKSMQDQGKRVSTGATPGIDGVGEEFSDLEGGPEQRATNLSVSTPNVPLPPSPYDEETAEGVLEPTPEPAQKPLQHETLYFLPALAYIPPSPQLPPDPVLLKRETETPEEKTNQKTVLGPTQASSQELTDEYDPYRADDLKPQTTPIIEPNTTTSAATTTATLHQNHNSPQLTDTHGTEAWGSQNPWKAFFTGQPSPAGSGLSIRSIKRESLVDQRPQSRDSAQSPAVRSSASGSGRHPFPASSVTSPDVVNSAKETVWFNKPFDEVRRSSLSQPAGSDEVPSHGQGTKVEGLGITT
ncbi:hypothetical protein PMZ80_000978 [Knufia obscura]|uniref:Uncharacterized protein n=1 Tax=Knufia obscura TaxID=1635080 RepID=A0ABR0S2Y9_9EURO|nr:hypothetical protein PMZ80_000978 [Knufia obscura]